MADEPFFKSPKAARQLNPASVNVRSRRAHSKPARVNLKPQEFEDLIEDQGVYVRITPTVLCPNRTDLTDTNHVLDCPLCGGNQVIDAPESAVEEWGFIQGISLEKDLQVQGIFDIKDAKITTKQRIKLYYWYKIEVLDFAAVYNQILKRGSGDLDRVRYAPAKPGATLVTTAVDEVNSQKAPDVPYILIDSKGTRYTIDQHYTVVGQDLKWKGVKRPDPGTLYSLVYPVLPTFRVIEMLHEHRYYYVDFKRTNKVPVHLPQQAVIRWDYLAKGSGSNIPLPPTTP